MAQWQRVANARARSSMWLAVVLLGLQATLTAAYGQSAAPPSAPKASPPPTAAPVTAAPVTAAPATSPVTNASVEAGSLHAQGKAFYGNRDYAKAIEMYSKAITVSPGYADAWYDRGVAHMTKGEFAAALVDYAKAADLFPATQMQRRADSYAARGRTLTRMGRLDEALGDFDRAERQTKAWPGLLALRGFAQVKAGKPADAITSANKALALDSFSSSATLARGVRAMALALQKDYAASTAELRAVVDRTNDMRTAAMSMRGIITLGTSSETPMTIRIMRHADPACEPNCPEWIAMQGRIERGQESQLADVLAKVGKKQLPILIDSAGGNVIAGIAMGRMIRERDLDVIVARTDAAPACGTDKACTARLKGGRTLGTATNIAALCSSSCVYVLAAGARRIVSPVAMIGVHQITFYRTYKETPSEEQIKRDQERGRISVPMPGGGTRLLGAVDDKSYIETRTYYRDMGIDESIMRHLLGAPTNGMAWLSITDLLDLRLVTGFAPIEQVFSDEPIAPVVVTMAAPKPSEPAGSPAELAAALNRELKRIGCLTDETTPTTWTSATQRAITRYTTLTGRSVPTDRATQTALDAVRGQVGLACPAACPRDAVEREGFCVKAGKAK